MIGKTELDERDRILMDLPAPVAVLVRREMMINRWVELEKRERIFWNQPSPIVAPERRFFFVW